MTEEESDFIPGEQNFNQWTDLTLVQQRSHSVLYKAKRYGRWFMLKTLRPEHAHISAYITQQQHEFLTAVTLHHPFIAETYSLETVCQMTCIVQEYVDGTTLDQWLGQKPTIKQKQKILAQLLEALDYLHASGITHNDLKPANILITRNGSNLRLIDFGLTLTDDNATMKPDISNDIRQLHRIISRLGFKPLNGSTVAEMQKCLALRNSIRHRLPYIILLLLILTTTGLSIYYMNHKHSLQLRNDEIALDSLRNQLNSDSLLINSLQDSTAALQSQINAQSDYIDSTILREQQMMQTITKAFAKEEAYWWRTLDTCYTHTSYAMAIVHLSNHAFHIRDSIANLYPENDPLRTKAWDFWVQKQTILNNKAHSRASH